MIRLILEGVVMGLCFKCVIGLIVGVDLKFLRRLEYKICDGIREDLMWVFISYC